MVSHIVKLVLLVTISTFAYKPKYECREMYRDFRLLDSLYIEKNKVCSKSLVDAQVSLGKIQQENNIVAKSLDSIKVLNDSNKVKMDTLTNQLDIYYQKVDTLQAIVKKQDETIQWYRWGSIALTTILVILGITQ